MRPFSLKCSILNVAKGWWQLGGIKILSGEAVKEGSSENRSLLPRQKETRESCALGDGAPGRWQGKDGGLGQRGWKVLAC